MHFPSALKSAITKPTISRIFIVCNAVPCSTVLMPFDTRENSCFINLTLMNLTAVGRLAISGSLLETHLAKCYTSPNLLPQILAQVTISGLINDTYAASRIISLRATSLFFPLHFSQLLLHQIKYPNGLIWNSVMRGAIKRTSPYYFIPLYSSLIIEDLEVVDKYTYPILLHASAIRSCEFEGSITTS
jgi:hypothetical protein